MTDSIGDALRRLALAGVGAAAVSAEKTQALLGRLTERGEEVVKQGKVANEELRRNLSGASDADAAPTDAQLSRLSDEALLTTRERLDEIIRKRTEGKAK